MTRPDPVNLGVQVIDDTQHPAATLLIGAREAANAWTAECGALTNPEGDRDRQLLAQVA